MRFFTMLSLLALVASGTASAAEKRHGSWASEDMGSYAAAHTSNESGSVFGMLCGDGCVFFLGLGRKCDEGSSYPAMISSAAGAHAIDLTCFVTDKEYLLTFEISEAMLDTLDAGGTIGFALPLADGEFGVSRFSLKGGSEAVDEVARIAKGKEGKDGKSGLRDFTI